MSVRPLAQQTPRFDASSWADASARATLQLIAESVAQMVGFEVANISAVKDGALASVALEGGDEVREAMAQMRTPLDNVLNELALAEDWGRFKFVPHHLMDLEDDYRWIPDFVPGDGPEDWHPHDALLAPLYSEDGRLLGLLSIDLPLTRRRPDATQRGLLERYAAQAERALQNAFDRDALAGRLRLAEAARQVVRFAVSQPDIETALHECRPALLEGFRADDVTIRTYADQLVGSSVAAPKPLPESMRRLLQDLAITCWERQQVAVLHPGRQRRQFLDPENHEQALAGLTSLGHASGMLVPIGAGQQCLGHLVMLRSDPDLLWTADERSGALEVARDIGHAVQASRNLVREQRLVSDLRELDTYKTQLLSTVSHELKNPLGAIAGHLELVASTPDLPEDTQFSLGAMGRATERITRVVDDLLALAKLEDPDTREVATVTDLRPALDASLDGSQFEAERRGLGLRLSAPEGPLPVWADDHGLERIFTNLVSNAVKYTERGGTVTIEVTYLRPGPDVAQGPVDVGEATEVEVAVRDEGIGISTDDQARLFTEFFRSTNPAALAQPGTGLGLAISARIVDGLDGRITVDSALGEGSTFRVHLRTAAPATAD